jgi:hypothetical protein
MRQIKYIETNEIALVEDQEATDAIASGKAVPSIDPIKKSVEPKKTVATEKAPEINSFAQAPEIK